MPETVSKPEKITTAVIAAAGQGTRMWPASKVFPKELFPLGKIPVLVHLVWELMDAGIEHVIIVAAPHNSGFLSALFDPKCLPPEKLAADPLVKRFQEGLNRCRISIIEQKGNYGNGTPLRLAVEQFGKQPCIYAFGDDIVIGQNATLGLQAIYQRTGWPVMAAQEVSPERKCLFGILECEKRDGADSITRVLEKPKLDDTASNLASFGRYLVTPAVIDLLGETRPGKDGEIWFVDAIIAHLRAGGRACAFRLNRGIWYTVGDPKGYAEAVVAATQEQRESSAANC
jgi:UTP--glucose-1-phosphate uridylyltransferase